MRAGGRTRVTPHSGRARLVRRGAARSLRRPVVGAREETLSIVVAVHRPFMNSDRAASRTFASKSHRCDMPVACEEETATRQGGHCVERYFEMEPLHWPAFVLQRRINAPLVEVERVLCDQRRVDTGTSVPIDESMHTTFDTRFELVFPLFGFEATSWRAFVTVRAKRRRRETLEIEVNAWDRRSTELVVRPRSSPRQALERSARQALLRMRSRGG